MRVAIVHDYIKEYGGAERVLETLHEMYPDAPVYTLVYAPQFLGPHRQRFNGWDIRESWVGKVPFKHKFISIFRLIAPFVFRGFDFSKYDVVIVSATGAYSPNVIRTKLHPHPNPLRKGAGDQGGSVHICYCHTPPRYLYGYPTARIPSKNLLIKAMVAIMVHILRMVDFKAAQNVDIFIANSQNTAKRIEKFYRRESVVVYPPVDLPTKDQGSRINDKNEISRQAENTKYEIRNTKYYLAGGRLARPKHIDLIIDTCGELGIELKVFGRGFAGFEEEIKNKIEKIKNKNKNAKIELLGEVGDEEKLELMRNAKAFIFAAEDEDFGIVPVEAMGQGTPVIAYKSGGVLETVIDGKTGVFFDELTVESLTKAIHRFNDSNHRSRIKPEDCVKQAEKFSKEAFVKGINKIITNN